MNSYCEKTLIETDTVCQNSIENVMTGATLKVNWQANVCNPLR